MVLRSERDPPTATMAGRRARPRLELRPRDDTGPPDQVFPPGGPLLVLVEEG
jgi:hypothetical protein